jgi:RHS repeat-associated protein
MGRLLNMTRTDVTPAQSVASAAAYNEADQLVSYTANNTLNWEQRQYDTMRRLTSLRIGGGVPMLNVAYNYTAGYSPGKITSMTDSVASQTVSYSYDSLNRLASAAATGGSAWSQTYSFDGFGNLTGNGNWTQSVNAANNQISTVSYDANGNQTQSAIIGQSGNATLSYDVENRLTAMVYGANPPVTIGQYAYNPSNQRVWRQAVENGVTAEYFYFYGIDGKREATYKVTSNAPTGLNSYRAALVGTAQDVLVYFWGETIQEGSYGSTLALSYVTADRLGSMPGGAKLDPYGQEISATANDKIKFATYLRDGESGIDYAMNRLYAAGRGRFLSADPYRVNNSGPGDPGAPGSWNRYVYALGNPTNFYDPFGLDYTVPPGGVFNPSDPRNVDPSGTSVDVPGNAGAAPTDPGIPPPNGSRVADNPQQPAKTVGNWDDTHSGPPKPSTTMTCDATVLLLQNMTKSFIAGVFAGGMDGFVTGGALGLGVGSIPGVLGGAVIGGVVGSGMGVLKGAIVYYACSLSDGRSLAWTEWLPI